MVQCEFTCLHRNWGYDPYRYTWSWTHKVFKIYLDNYLYSLLLEEPNKMKLPTFLCVLFYIASFYRVFMGRWNQFILCIIWSLRLNRQTTTINRLIVDCFGHKWLKTDWKIIKNRLSMDWKLPKTRL